MGFASVDSDGIGNHFIMDNGILERKLDPAKIEWFFMKFSWDENVEKWGIFSENAKAGHNSF